MKLGHEPKMTIICKSCEHQYGAWRPQCPTCGTDTPAPPKREVKARTRRERTPSPHLCIFCQHRGAKKLRCPHCEEPIHKNCLTLHAKPCEQFQIERRKAEEALCSKH